MHRTAVRALTLLALAVPLAAQNAPSTPASLPSVTLPADLDRVLRDYEKAWKANDVPKLVSLFTDDGFVMQPGRQPARGKAGLTQTYTGQGGGDLRLRALAYAAGDTVGYIIGAYTYGDAPGDMGKFTLALRRARGGPWLIASDMDNGNAPRRPGPPPPR